MKKFFEIILCVLLIAVSSASSQEVVVTGFPPGVGGSIDPRFFEPYHQDLRAVADVLQNNPLSYAIVVGGADGQRYKRDNDAKNPALALGRAHALGNLLINKFGVDSAQIKIRSEDVKAEGERYRYVSVRVDKAIAGLSARVDTIAAREPIERHFTELQEIHNDLTDSMGVRLGFGVSSSPFGAIPLINGAVSWKNALYLEFLFGHTFWNEDYEFEDANLDTKRRLFGGEIVYYPFEKKNIGIIGGWIRIEEISLKYYEYVRLSEGPIVGIRVEPWDAFSLSGTYNPARQRTLGSDLSTSKNAQFLLSLSYSISLGGNQ